MSLSFVWRLNAATDLHTCCADTEQPSRPGECDRGSVRLPGERHFTGFTAGHQAKGAGQIQVSTECVYRVRDASGTGYPALSVLHASRVSFLVFSSRKNTMNLVHTKNIPAEFTMHRLDFSVRTDDFSL